MPLVGGTHPQRNLEYLALAGEDEYWGGLEKYGRSCEEAASQLLRWERESGGVLNEILVGARVYLECYQLKRAPGACGAGQQASRYELRAGHARVLRSECREVRLD